jgi:hypothetical protein
MKEQIREIITRHLEKLYEKGLWETKQKCAEEIED